MKLRTLAQRRSEIDIVPNVAAASGAFQVSLMPIGNCFQILVPVEPLRILMVSGCTHVLESNPCHVPVNFFVAIPDGMTLDAAREWLRENRPAIEAECRKKLLTMRCVN